MIPEASKHGDCFEVSGTLVAIGHFKDPVLVHGEVCGQGKIDGIHFCHAWIECGDTVYDFSNNMNKSFSKKVYYAIAKVVDEPGKLVKYTVEQTLKMMDKHLHYGPWELECKL